MSALDPNPAFRDVIDPLRLPAEDWQVTDAQAALAGARLAALDDATFTAVAGLMASVEGGKYLRRLLTETEEERAEEVPEALRAFAARLAARAAPAAARAALRNLRGHALGRLLWALGAAPREDARRFARAAGGADAVAAVAVEEALRAIADDSRRAIRSLSAGLGAIFALAPPSGPATRQAAALLAKKINEWSGPACEALVQALDRGAVMDADARGFVPDSRGLPPPFGGDDALVASLYEELVARRGALRYSA